jgi:hypothetical protein
MRFVAALMLSLLVTGPAAAQMLSRGSVGSSKAVVFQQSPDGKNGEWKRQKVAVEGTGFRVGERLIPFGEIKQASYDRRSVTRTQYSRIRHVLTIHFSTPTGGDFLMLELGKDIAELTVNQLQARVGVPIERKESYGR